MAIDTLSWRNGEIHIIDQTLLPGQRTYRVLQTLDQVVEAVKALRVRGAPALGAIAALGVLVGLRSSTATDVPALRRDLEHVAGKLRASRPTAVNLFWALNRMARCAERYQDNPVEEVRQALEREAQHILEEDRHCNRRIGAWGATLLEDGDTVLTHCNAGALATVDYGTALGIIYHAHNEGKRIGVYADETRPLLQGSRLSAWELLEEGIEVTVICDSAAGEVMRQGRVNKVIVGADRVTSNGDTANKIGTYGLAVLAHEHRIPFYVACPFSTIDPALSDGGRIPIEQRAPEEVAVINGVRTAPVNAAVYNPAFDVTPARYLTALITERGIYYPPFRFTSSDQGGTS